MNSAPWNPALVREARLSAQNVSARAKAPTGPTPHAEDPPETRPVAQWGTDAPKILIVEDSPTQAFYLQALLDQQGLRTYLAPDGRRGMEMARQHRPDLIILDLELPYVRGDEVLIRIKRDPELRDIPVIMVSTSEEIELVARCIEMGAEDYLPKPYHPTILYARVHAGIEKKRMRDEEQRARRRLEEERSRFDELLHVILPDDVVEELKTTGMVKPRLHQDVAVLFVDVVDFTTYCNERAPEEIFTNLQLLSETYETLAVKHRLEKIKTTGDAFLATVGLPVPASDPVLACVRCALEMIPAARLLPANWQVRAGIHVGPVMAGVVGHRKYLYDIWGDTVNTAQRIESYGQRGAVNLSREAWLRIRDHCEAESMGLQEVKGKGALEIYRVLKLKQPGSSV